ncbi:MAG: xanthine dehydrogenase family protein molybdopterin-binding subunit [Betaproteobacteria bacterium]|nr:xanthine dehydrogenase family protein molybdopterin-binding subunit [Betaproteobacteria bacterium]
MVKFGIGQAITRREDQRLLTGQGQYVDDVAVPGETFVAFVRSPHAHAKIVSVDTTNAQPLPGVVAVITGAQMLADGIGAFPINPALKNPAGNPMSAPPYYALATDAVRYVGQAVAAVIAETRLQAEDAAEQVIVEYEELPSVTTLEAATAEGALQLWPDAPGNVAAQMRFGKRDQCDAAFAAAAHVTKISFMNQRLVPVSMEPRGTIAEFDPATGRYTVRTSCQNPAGLQKTLAENLLNVPAEKVRVIVGDVGGGFGMKTQLYPEDAVCAYAAKKTGRPVHWRASRSDEFLAGNHGRDQYDEAELALDADGKILGFRVNIVGNIGAYAIGPGAIIVVAVGPKVITGVYHVPALDLKGTAVITNTNVVGAYRGAGRPEAIYLIERLMDQAAAEMKIDPAEIRRRNLIQPTAMPYKTPMGEKFDSGNFPHMLDRILELADWKGYAARKEASKGKGKLRGRAISTFLEWTGVVHEEAVRMEVTGDGKVIVYTAMQAMGQGIETSYVQIIAETLSVDPDRIVVVQGDSDVAQGIGSMGSRSLYIGGSAMMTASKEAIQKGRELAGDALEASATDIEYKDGRFTVAGTDVGIDMFELAGRQPEKRIAIATLQKVDGPSWPNSCHVCEVEIDPDTGVVEIVKYTTLDDVGRVINPMIVAGQVHGGIAQAMGQAMLEDTRYDPDSGQLLSGSLLDYCIPRADDLPDLVQHCDESTPCKINPLGAKGVGELGTVGGTPTIVNAIVDALRPFGVTNIEMPATSERVWKAMKAAA